MFFFKTKNQLLKLFSIESNLNIPILYALRQSIFLAYIFRMYLKLIDICESNICLLSQHNSTKWKILLEKRGIGRTVYVYFVTFHIKTFLFSLAHFFSRAIQTLAITSLIVFQPTGFGKFLSKHRYSLV